MVIFELFQLLSPTLLQFSVKFVIFNFEITFSSVKEKVF